MSILLFASRIRNTRGALWTGVQTCALPICTNLDLVQHNLALRQIAFEQLAREVIFVLEMIEESALGNTSRLDQFLDRRRGEALLNDRVIGKVEQPLVRLRPFAGRQLYRR